MSDERRLDVLDGLRGIAVLLVLWYHVWESSFWTPGNGWDFLPATGFIGVHLFFFLSGFVIIYPFVRALKAGKAPPTWRHFYYRRAIKIVPSYLISIAVAYAIGYNAKLASGGLWPDLVTHLLFIHTWWPATSGAINGVLWTLAVEVEFYCIFPLIWWLFKRSPWLTAIMLATIALVWRAMIANCCTRYGLERLEANLPGYLDIFASGMLASWVFVQYGERIRSSPWRLAMPVVALAGVAVAAMLLINLYDFRFVNEWSAAWEIRNRTLFCIPFIAIAIGLLCAPRWWQVLLANAPLRFMGFISYNMYLYHQMIALKLLDWHIPPYSGNPHLDPHWQMTYTATAFAVVILIATVFTYCIERPIMKLRLPVHR